MNSGRFIGFDRSLLPHRRGARPRSCLQRSITPLRDRALKMCPVVGCTGALLLSGAEPLKPPFWAVDGSCLTSNAASVSTVVRTLSGRRYNTLIRYELVAQLATGFSYSAMEARN